MTDDAETPTNDLDPRVYFAAERTLLAWLRTGLAMMGFGFVVARFGLFLRELAAVKDGSPDHGFGLSLWGGTGLVVLGVGVNAAAALRHWSIIRRLERGEPLKVRRWSLGMVTALVLAAAGMLTAVYLVVGVR